jgi:DNA-directed RNA polymerase specialized sigma24 family protein
MAVQFRWSATPDEDAEDPASADWSTFTDIFREYAAYIFEYCVKLLNDEGEAAGATTVTFITAQALLDHLEDYDRLEAWLYALARRECTSKHPARSGRRPPPPGRAPVPERTRTAPGRPPPAAPGPGRTSPPSRLARPRRALRRRAPTTP